MEKIINKMYMYATMYLMSKIDEFEEDLPKLTNDKIKKSVKENVEIKKKDLEEIRAWRKREWKRELEERLNGHK